MKKFHIVFLFFVLICTRVFAQSFSKYILVDQFGYRPQAEKVAIIRDPQVGYDKDETYTPGNTYRLVNVTTKQSVFEGTLTKWRNGATHENSGDKIWWFDFTAYQGVGNFYISDATTGEKSAEFEIGNEVYKPVLKAAFKTFYFQRAGFEKKVQQAGVWADGASHVKNLQDKNCRVYNQKTNAATEKDLSGGWYDAGDYNKYTPWTANYVVNMLLAYEENKKAWTDDFEIPESGNGIPDVLDEAKWGLDWLLKMSQDNGSCLSIVGLASGSPPSSANGPSYYGTASTNATLRCAAAFALAARIYNSYSETAFGSYAQSLEAKAKAAWDWGINNPSIIFPNNSSSNGSQGLGAGNQETDDLGRVVAKIKAALYLYQLTNDNKYLSAFEAEINNMPLLQWGNYVSQYFQEQEDLLLQYTALGDAKPDLVSKIKNATTAGSAKAGDFGQSLLSDSDPYKAFIKDYNWGSNQYKSGYGNFFMWMNAFDIDANNKVKYLNGAENYLHYIHGVNPMAFVYLSNMSKYGAENNIKEFYHSWFSDGSSKWDREGVSQFGPAPGFLVGGPNQFYQKDGCCPNNCGSTQSNAVCNSENLTQLFNQPPMKTYKDFNTSWPLNSWQVTENSNGYQIEYLRLLSKFVGETQVKTVDISASRKAKIYPNIVSQNQLTVELESNEKTQFSVYDISGKIVFEAELKEQISTVNLPTLSKGTYLVKLRNKSFENAETIIVP